MNLPFFWNFLQIVYMMIHHFANQKVRSKNMIVNLLLIPALSFFAEVQAQNYVNCGALSGCSDSVFIARNQCFCGSDADALSSCIFQKYPSFPFAESVSCPDMKSDSIGYQKCVADRIDSISPEAMAALNGCINVVRPKVRATIPDEPIDGVVLENLSSSIALSFSLSSASASAMTPASTVRSSASISLASPSLSVAPQSTTMPSASI
jgi:hypothetical protein